jgi:hypothetical protein
MEGFDPAKRVPFVMTERERLSPQGEARKVAALEHIAHYLDRIDLHLERLVELAEKQAQK